MVSLSTVDVNGQEYRVRQTIQASSKDRRKFVIHMLEHLQKPERGRIFRTSYGLRVERIVQGHYSIQDLDGLDVYCDDPAAP